MTVLPHSRRFVRDYVVAHWRWYIAGTLAVFLTNFLGVRIPVELGHGLDALRTGDPAVGTAALKIGAFGLLVIVVRTVSRLWFFTPARMIEFDLREAFFAHCLRLQPDVFARYPTGDLLSRATSDVTFARVLGGFALLQTINVVAALSLSLAQMLAISPLLTLTTAIPIGLGYAVVQAGTGRLFNLQRDVQQELARFSDRLLGSIQGVGTIQAYCVEDAFSERLDTQARHLRAMNLKLARLRALVFPFLTISAGISVFLLLSVGGSLALEGTLSPGALAGFVALVAYLLMPLRLLGVLLPVFQRTEVSLERIHAILDTPVDRPEAGRVAPIPAGGPTISLRGLSYAYPDAPERRVLSDISVDLPGGAAVGIFGKTGSGKTTLLRMLARLRNPPEGTVLVGGTDVRHFDLDAWRKAFVMVPQAPFLFSETIRENVGLGMPAERIAAAVEAASLQPDLAALPDAMNTIVGERGIVLSGGQRQRVTLARGLAREGSLVLLDDVLSAVDHTTEQELLRTLRTRFARGATTILVSHRMSALEQCDVVLILDGGRLVDSGTHAELVERPGVYREAWLAQRVAS